MKERDSDKVKLWEKRRRDRLKDSFHSLAQLLPQYDPAKIPPQNDILDKATQFVKELRLSNSRLLTQQTQADEKNKLIQELQDEVNKLILRVKQLTSLLTEAKISIPAGPCMKFLGKRKLKWSDKILPNDVENKKRKMAPAKSKKNKEITKENAKDEATACSQTNLPALNSTLSSPLRETNSSNEGKKLEVSPAAIVPFNSPQIISPTTTDLSAQPGPGLSQVLSPDKDLPNLVSHISLPVLKQTPMTFTLPVPVPVPVQSSSTPTIILTSSSLTPVHSIVTRVTAPLAPHPIFPKPDSFLLPKLPIVRIRQPIPVVKKTRQRKKKQPQPQPQQPSVTSVDSSTTQTQTQIQIQPSTSNNETINDSIEQKQEEAATNNQTKLESSLISDEVEATSENSETAKENPLLFEKSCEPSTPNQVSPLPLEEQEGSSHTIIAAATYSSTENATTTECSSTSTESHQDLNQFPSPAFTSPTQSIPSRNQSDSSSSIVDLESVGIITVTANSTNCNSDTTLSATTQDETVSETASKSTLPSQNSDGLFTHNQNTSDHLTTESQTETGALYSAIDNVVSKDPSDEAENIASSPSTTPDCVTISALESNSSKSEIISDSGVTGAAKSSLAEFPDPQMTKKKDALLEPPSLISTQPQPSSESEEINFVANDNDSTCTLPKEPESMLDIEPRVIAAPVVQPVNMMSDSLQDIADLIEPEVAARAVTKPTNTKITNTSQNEVDDISQVSASNENDKISECIARSIDLIDQPEAELMELSGDWGDGHSPKSPISPTQMFLSMFPLLPRESIISSSEPSNHHGANKSVGHFSSVKSSFYIDAMLPEENLNSAGSEFGRSMIPVPGSVTSILNPISSNNHINSNSTNTTNQNQDQTQSHAHDHATQVNCVLTNSASSINMNSTAGNENADPFSFQVSINTSTTISHPHRSTENQQEIHHAHGHGHRSLAPSNNSSVSSSAPNSNSNSTKSSSALSGFESTSKKSGSGSGSGSQEKQSKRQTDSSIIPYSESTVVPGAATVFSQISYNSNSTSKGRDLGINWAPFYYPENSVTSTSLNTKLPSSSSSNSLNCLAADFQRSYGTTGTGTGTGTGSTNNLHRSENNLGFRPEDISMPMQQVSAPAFTPSITNTGVSVDQDNSKRLKDSVKSLSGSGQINNVLNTYKPYMDNIHSNVQELQPMESNNNNNNRSSGAEIGFNSYTRQTTAEQQQDMFFPPAPAPSILSASNEYQHPMFGSSSNSMNSTSKRSMITHPPLQPLNNNNNTNAQQNYPLVQPSSCNMGQSTSTSTSTGTGTGRNSNSNSSRSSNSNTNKSQHQSKGSSSKGRSKSQMQDFSRSTPMTKQNPSNIPIPNPLNSTYAPQFDFFGTVPLPAVPVPVPVPVPASVEQCHSSQFSALISNPSHQVGISNTNTSTHRSIDARITSGRSNISISGNSAVSDSSPNDLFNLQNYRQTNSSISDSGTGRQSQSSRKNNRAGGGGSVAKATSNTNPSSTHAITNNPATIDFPASSNFSIANNFYYDSVLPPSSSSSSTTMHNQCSISHQNKNRQPFYLPDLGAVQNNCDFGHQQMQPILPATPVVQQIVQPQVPLQPQPQSQSQSQSSKNLSSRRSNESRKVCNYIPTSSNSNSLCSDRSNSFLLSNSNSEGGYNGSAIVSDANSAMINSYYGQHQRLPQQLSQSQSHLMSNSSAPLIVPDVHVQNLNRSSQNRPVKKPQTGGQNSNPNPNSNSNANEQGYASGTGNRILGQTHQHQHHQNSSSSSNRNGNGNTMAQSSSAQSRPVNWMTDSRPTSVQQSVSHPPACNRKQEISSATNPFSVSKLVGNASTNNNNNSSTYSSTINNHNNYCVEGLIRKQVNTEWNISHFSTGNNESQVTGSGPPPSFFPFQSQPTPDYGNFPSFTHHPHHSHHPTYQGVSNSPNVGPGVVGHFGHFDQSQSQNLLLQHQPHQSSSRSIGNSNNHFVTPTSISHYLHPTDNSGVENSNRNPSIHPHLQHGTHQQQHHGTSSVSNFNLSSIFPEMNEKRNCNTSNSNANNNRNSSSNTSGGNNSANLYYSNSSNHNPNK